MKILQHKGVCIEDFQTSYGKGKMVCVIKKFQKGKFLCMDRWSTLLVMEKEFNKTGTYPVGDLDPSHVPYKHISRGKRIPLKGKERLRGQMAWSAFNTMLQRSWYDRSVNHLLRQKPIVETDRGYKTCEGG